MTLDDRIGYRFKNPALLEEALTHASAVDPNDDRPTYQRLEFLGDRVLGVVIADMVFHAFPDADEGELSKRLTRLVRKETCAYVADELGLGAHVRRGGGERHARPGKAILGDVCEAVIGAIYIDGGYDAAARFIDTNWRRIMMQSDAPLRDAKTALQEWAHVAGHGTPSYREIDRSGPDHAPMFTIEVLADGLKPEKGTGGSKREAEQAAAQAMLDRERARQAIDG